MGRHRLTFVPLDRATVGPSYVRVAYPKKQAFNPKSVTIRAGQTVAWKFDDPGIEHNVTGDGLHSPDRVTGYFTHTFVAAGTYSYRCTLHTA